MRQRFESLSRRAAAWRLFNERSRKRSNEARGDFEEQSPVISWVAPRGRGVGLGSSGEREPSSRALFHPPARPIENASLEERETLSTHACTRMTLITRRNTVTLRFLFFLFVFFFFFFLSMLTPSRLLDETRSSERTLLDKRSTQWKWDNWDDAHSKEGWKSREPPFYYTTGTLSILISWSVLNVTNALSRRSRGKKGKLPFTTVVSALRDNLNFTSHNKMNTCVTCHCALSRRSRKKKKKKIVFHVCRLSVKRWF